MSKVYDNLMKSGKFTAAQNKAESGEFVDSIGELVALCEKELEWKKSTTYTVLKKLCARGLFENTRGTVTVCVTKEEFDAIRSEQFVEDTFEGSLPAFIAAFTKRKALTEEEVALIRDMIESHKEG